MACSEIKRGIELDFVNDIFRQVTVPLVLIGLSLACNPFEGDRGSESTAECAAHPSAPTLAQALEEGGALCRARRIADALDALGAEPDRAFIETLDAEIYRVDDASLSLILRSWTETEPRAAFEYARRLPPARRALAVRIALEGWAESDPRAAAAALESIPTKQRTENLALAVARGWEASNQPGLDAFISERRPGRGRMRMLAEILMRIAHRDGADEMIRWVESLPDDAPTGFRLEAHRLAASTLSQIDVERARDWATSQSDPAYRARMLGSVTMHWVRTDPGAAMAWVSTHPPGAERDRIVLDAYRALSRRDREAASAWFEGQPYADWLEPALAFHLGAVAHLDGATAIAQIDRIKDEERRRTTTIAILRQWRLQDRPAADAWLALADLAPEVLDRILHEKHLPSTNESFDRDR